MALSFQSKSCPAVGLVTALAVASSALGFGADSSHAQQPVAAKAAHAKKCAHGKRRRHGRCVRVHKNPRRPHGAPNTPPPSVPSQPIVAPPPGGMTDPPPGPHGPGAGKRPAAHAATTYVFEGCAATYWFDPDYRVYWTYCAWYTSDATTIKDYFAWTDTGWAFWFETEDYSLA